MTDLIPGIRPYFETSDEDLDTIAGLLRSGQVTNNGPYVKEFEAKLAAYLGVEETVAVSNGSDALLLALTALRLPPGKIILPAYTFAATLNAVVHAGFVPVFSDIEPETYTLDPVHLAALLERHADVRCVIPVNVFGIPPDLAGIKALCDPAGIRLVYDNAHGFGTTCQGLKLGTEPDIQCFSFHATKALPAIEGGMALALDPAVGDALRRLRNHGLGTSPEAFRPGFNAKLDEIRAVIGLGSLRHFPATLARRRAYGQRLLHAFSRFPEAYAAQAIPSGVETNFQNLGVRCRAARRVGMDRVIGIFAELGVGVRSYFNPPLHKFKGFGTGPALPNTESVWETLVSFPIHGRMPEESLAGMEYAIARFAGMG